MTRRWWFETMLNEVNAWERSERTQITTPRSTNYETGEPYAYKDHEGHEDNWIFSDSKRDADQIKIICCHLNML